jgi:hypothetical protein
VTYCCAPVSVTANAAPSAEADWLDFIYYVLLPIYTKGKNRETINIIENISSIAIYEIFISNLTIESFSINSFAISNANRGIVIHMYFPDIIN